MSADGGGWLHPAAAAHARTRLVGAADAAPLEAERLHHRRAHGDPKAPLVAIAAAARRGPPAARDAIRRALRRRAAAVLAAGGSRSRLQRLLGRRRRAAPAAEAQPRRAARERRAGAQQRRRVQQPVQRKDVRRHQAGHPQRVDDHRGARPMGWATKSWEGREGEGERRRCGRLPAAFPLCCPRRPRARCWGARRESEERCCLRLTVRGRSGRRRGVRGRKQGWAEEAVGKKRVAHNLGRVSRGGSASVDQRGGASSFTTRKRHGAVRGAVCALTRPAAPAGCAPRRRRRATRRPGGSSPAASGRAAPWPPAARASSAASGPSCSTWRPRPAWPA